MRSTTPNLLDAKGNDWEELTRGNSKPSLMEAVSLNYTKQKHQGMGSGDVKNNCR